MVWIVVFFVVLYLISPTAFLLLIGLNLLIAAIIGASWLIASILRSLDALGQAILQWRQSPRGRLQG